MKIWIFSYYPVDKIFDSVSKYGFELDKKTPDIILTFGGDGTILTSEKEYPGIPKIVIKKSGICRKCFEWKLKDLEFVLERIKNGTFEIISYNKVEANFKKRVLVGLNEVQIHNRDPRKALRFSIEMNGKGINNVIGDGIVAATPFGSTAYYKVIGYRPFKNGIRIGFNNTIPKPDPWVLKAKSIVKVEILREKGYLAVDNTELVKIRPKDTIYINMSKKMAKFIKINP